MYRYFLLSLLSVLLHATEVKIYVPCHDSKPYAYCIDNKPTGVSVDILKAIFQKFEDYTLTLLPLDANSTNVKIIAPITQNQLTHFDVINLTEPILENNESNALYIGFSETSFFKQKDLLGKINLAIEIMHSRKQIEDIFEDYKQKYETYKEGKEIEIGLYNWGEKMVSEKIETFGLIPEIITAAFHEKNIKVKYNFFEHYNYLYLMGKWGKVCTSGPWLKTFERKDYFYFSDNLFTTIEHLYYLKEVFPNAIKYDHLNDLTEYRIGGVSGMFYEKIFKENKLMRYSSYLTHKNAIKGLLAQEVDIVISETHHFEKTQSLYFPAEEKSMVFHPKPLFTKGNYLTFSKSCPESEVLREQFNHGLDIIQKNGLLDQIFLKYDEKIKKLSPNL